MAKSFIPSSLPISIPRDFSKRSVRLGWCTCITSVLLVSAILIGVSLRKLSSTEFGVEYDRYKKTLDDAAKTGGLHAGPPGYYFVKFPSTQITSNLMDICVSRDGLRVNFEVSFQYQIPAEKIVNVIQEFRDFPTWAKVVEAAGNSAVQHSCSEFNVTDFQSVRVKIQESMFKNLKLKLEGSNTGDMTDVGVEALAISLQLRSVFLPIEYQNAISEKQSAEEDILLATNQRIQERTKAETELKVARQEVTKIFNTAYNKGNVTILQAELKAQETLFAFEKEREVLEESKKQFSLSANGILAYMTNQLYASLDNLEVTSGEPAKISGLFNEVSVPVNGAR